MIENTLHRIKKYIDFKGISISAFEKKNDFSNGAFSNQLKKNKTIGVDKIENILKNHTDLNPIWLLTGNGKMIVEVNNKQNDIDMLILKNENELLKKDVDYLKIIIENQKKIIDTNSLLIEAIKKNS